VVDKFPNEPIAVDAQYQIGYIWFHASQTGTKDIAATSKAKTAFQDFLFHYPNSEKAAQARADLDKLEQKQTSSSFEVAKFYDKQKYYRAAVIYANEVIRQQPGSTESDRAKKRIDELRTKVGEAALQPAFTTGEAAKKKGGAPEARTAKSGAAAKPGPANNEAPLPAPETDVSLPPPASLAPDTTTAPEPLPAPPSTSTSSGASPAPGAAASPEASGSPAP
jgi:outer membrane protein assembly factor BamD